MCPFCVSLLYTAGYNFWQQSTCSSSRRFSRDIRPTLSPVVSICSSIPLSLSLSLPRHSGVSSDWKTYSVHLFRRFLNGTLRLKAQGWFRRDSKQAPRSISPLRLNKRRAWRRRSASRILDIHEWRFRCLRDRVVCGFTSTPRTWQKFVHTNANICDRHTQLRRIFPMHFLIPSRFSRKIKSNDNAGAEAPEEQSYDPASYDGDDDGPWASTRKC